MYLTTNICLCFFSEILLISVAISFNRANEGTLSSKLYNYMVYFAIFLLIIDLFARMDGLGHPAYRILNNAGNLILFISNPVFPILWLLYAHNQIFSDDIETKRLGRIFSIVIVVNAIVSVLSLFNGWYYYIDEGNVYHRGRYYIISVIIDQVIMISTFILVIVNRKRIEKRYYLALLSLGVVPTICFILQVFIYGIAFALSGIAISLVITFINTQNKIMNVDHLTGVYNRKQFDYYITDKVRKAFDKKSFSAILLDLDNFKSINDNFGHNVGDDALKTVVMLLKKCIRQSDFLARVGGDEFYIITDISEIDTLKNFIQRINSCIHAFNATSDKPYSIGVSIGYMIYDTKENPGIEHFKINIDRQMYLNKVKNKVIHN